MIAKRSRVILIALALAFLAGASVWWLRQSPSLPPKQTEPTVAKEPAVPVSPVPNEPIPASAFADRKRELLRMDPAEARDWILNELAAGKDYPTGSDLAIGTDQNLTSWPSYRTYLLDLLHLVDPAAAAAKSRELVDAGGTADEWAVALRNVAKADEAGTSIEWIREKTAELLRNETWRSDPSAGYLNAFDVIVHTENTELAPELLTLCNTPDQRAVRHASFLVVDRLTQRRPEAMLPLLVDSASRLKESGPMLSNLIARGDLRDEKQREAVERYLLDENRSANDLEGFASVFPNANFHVSNNLLTDVDGIDGIELAERDRAALETVRIWLEEPRFERLRPVLEKMRSRLEQFVKT